MFVELNTRYGDGLTVRLEWDRDSGETQIVLHDARSSDGLIAFRVPPGSAADAFHHPFRYAP
jgi:carotenoid cleavage dioxygenase-like enzyme